MVARERKYATGINYYVPGMQYASDMQLGMPSPFSLGSPAAASDTLITTTGINCQAAAGTVAAFSWTSDAPYGRTLQLKVSGDPGVLTSVVDVYGFDYLGQPMTERFTTINGSTAIQYGKKAFYSVYQTKIVTTSTNAVTARLGTAFRLGLPYKGDVVWAKENTAFVQIYKRDQTYWSDRSAVLAVAGGSKWVRAPFPGFVKNVIGIPDGGGGATDPVITVKLATVAIVGLTVTVDTSDTAGVTVTGTPTTAGYNANNRFIANSNIEVVGAAAAGAFGDKLAVTLTPTQVTEADRTDPATVSTGDTRGTYESLTVMAGFEIIVGLVADASVNASGNGGLYGIVQV